LYLGQSALGQSALGQSALGQSALGQSALGQSALGQSALGQSFLPRGVVCPGGPSKTNFSFELSKIRYVHSGIHCQYALFKELSFYSKQNSVTLLVGASNTQTVILVYCGGSAS